MLPPVQISQSATVYPQARQTATGTMGAAAMPQLGEPPAPSGLELNAAIAGRLNILLLTGTERTAEGFSILSDLLGKSLGITRKEGETQSNFMRRLAEVLAALPPSRRAVMERQFAELFKGLALQTLIAALSNPAGAQASRVAMWLDSQHDTRRDPATRSVITSYQQNDTEGMPDGPPTRQTAPASAPVSTQGTSSPANPSTAARTAGSIASQSTNASGTIPINIGANDASIEPAVAIKVSSEQSTSPAVDGQGRNSLPSGGANVETMASETTSPSGASTLSAQGAPDVEADLPPLRVPESLAPVPSSEAPDARTLQAKLRDAFSASTGLAGHGPEAELPKPAVEQRRADGVGRALLDTTEPEPTDEARRDTLFVLKGWQHVDVLPPLETPAEAEDALGKLLRAGLLAQTSSDEHTASETIVAADMSASSDPAQLLTDEPMSTTTSANAEGETVTAARPATDPDRDLDMAAQRMPADVDLTFSTTPPPMREGLAIPVINYLFAADEVVEDSSARHEENDGREEEMSGNADDENDQDDDREDPADETGDDMVSDEDEVRTAANEDDAPDTLAASQLSSQTTVSERANDLYWRMAGWA